MEKENVIALGDADKRLRAKERQIDLIHVWRGVNAAWQHNVDLKTRRQCVSEVKKTCLDLRIPLTGLI